MSKRIGFIGAGNMAQALIAGVLRSGVAPESIRIVDPEPGQREKVKATYGVSHADEAGQLAAWAEVLILAVKPQVAGVVLRGAASALTADKLLISVCAGVSLAAIESHAGSAARYIRSMPNTPALVGEGATALAAGPRVTSEDLVFAEQLFSSVGQCSVVPESYLDAVTGLSGSGPAFVMLVIEGLADGGVRAGLPRAVALKLATQTVLGSAKLVRETQQHPGVLKDQVTSPAGTTIEGVATLERGGLRGLLIDAVTAAAKRAAELGKA
jgi:pyrroline-5-carboxylate reductase